MNCCYKFLYCSYRVAFWITRLFKSNAEPRIKYHSVHPSKMPWLWIGAEMADGRIITVTDTVNQHMEYHDVVNSTYLETVTGVDTNVSRWLYLDSQTLVEQEFPPTGLVIKDDSNE